MKQRGWTRYWLAISRWLGVGLLAFVVLVLGAFIFFCYQFRESLRFRADPADYEWAVHRYDTLSIYDILPRQIHPEAERVAFFYVPGFAQGGDYIGLRVILPVESVERILGELERSGRKEVGTDAIARESTYPPYGLEKVKEDLVFSTVEKLPEGFRVFLHDTDLEDIRRNSNHNQMAFTAVSVERREVVYYAASW